jgi:hypothetical protein
VWAEKYDTQELRLLPSLTRNNVLEEIVRAEDPEKCALNEIERSVEILITELRKDGVED